MASYYTATSSDWLLHVADLKQPGEFVSISRDGGSLSLEYPTMKAAMLAMNYKVPQDYEIYKHGSRVWIEKQKSVGDGQTEATRG